MKLCAATDARRQLRNQSAKTIITESRLYGLMNGLMKCSKYSDIFIVVKVYFDCSEPATSSYIAGGRQSRPLVVLICKTTDPQIPDVSIEQHVFPV